ncbi:MAG: FimV/HubP family polar landmark protein [Motiliproteus sp.]
MLRKYAVTLAALGALTAPDAKALGLGEVTVHSSLNQPLSAEINLLQLRDLAKSQIIAGLADSDDFYLAGVKPTIILSDINFQMVVKDGKGVIRLTTTDPIKEPFLNFLVEVNWPSGRLVREYTILLDPPVFSAKDLAPRSAPAAPRTSSSSVSTAKAMPAAQGAPAPQTSGSNVRSRMDKDGQYYVDVHDTLWNVALKTRPDRSVSPQQMMLAIQRTNPEAFINNNINRLRSGVVLNIPSKQQIQSEDFGQSIEEVKRQNGAWKGKSPKNEASAKKKSEQLDASEQKSTQSASAVSQEQSQLRIVSKALDKVEATDKEDKAVSVDSQAASVEAPISEELVMKNKELEEQLVVTLEGLDKVERDNAELFERMDRMSEQLESVQRLLLLKDQQMADLSNKLVEAQSAVQPEMAPVSEQPQPSKGIIETLMQTPALLAAAGAGILALLVGLLFAVRKRKQGGDDDQAVEQAMAVLEEREQADKAEEQVEPKITESVEAIPEDALDEVAVDEDPDDPFNLSLDEDADEFDALISDDLDEQLGDDLDMDLKIDEPVDEDPEMAEFAASLLDDEEYNLATDEAELDISDEPQGTDVEAVDELDFAEKGAEESEEGDDDLDFILSASADEVDEEESDFEESLSEDDNDLDFIVSKSLDADDLDTEADDSLVENDELDSILGDAGDEDSEDLSDELESLLEEHASAESMDLDTVAHQGDEDDHLMDDGALDDLLNQAEEQDSSEADDETEDLNFETLDLDSLDLESDESQEAASEAEALDGVIAEEVEGVTDDSGLDALDLGNTDELADELNTMLESEQEVSGEVAEETAEELSSFALDDLDGAEADVTEVLVAEPEESELDAAGDAELEDELNLMLDGDDNELTLEETSVSEGDDELNYLDAADELGTKLDLARAYIDMDDPEGAKDILQEVVKDGSPEQVAEAQSLIDSL